MTKSIILAKTFPYNIHLKDKSSNLLIFSLFRSGPNIAGVIKSSTNDLVTSATLVAKINQIVTPITLYVSKKAINSDNIVCCIRNKKSFSESPYRNFVVKIN